MWTDDLLKRHLSEIAYSIVRVHGRHVADFALELAVGQDCDDAELAFIEEAALLHDIGVGRVYAPDIGCFGDSPYIMHGVIGRGILECEGYPDHALVCERHIGVGLTMSDIVSQGLPLPHRNMIPESRAERLICFADLFYSKRPGKLSVRKSIGKVRANLEQFGKDKLQIFDAWAKDFGLLINER